MKDGGKVKSDASLNNNDKQLMTTTTKCRLDHLNNLNNRTGQRHNPSSLPLI